MKSLGLLLVVLGASSSLANPIAVETPEDVATPVSTPLAGRAVVPPPPVTPTPIPMRWPHKEPIPDPIPPSLFSECKDNPESSIFDALTNSRTEVPCNVTQLAWHAANMRVFGCLVDKKNTKRKCMIKENRYERCRRQQRAGIMSCWWRLENFQYNGQPWGWDQAIKKAFPHIGGEGDAVVGRRDDDEE